MFLEGAPPLLTRNRLHDLKRSRNHRCEEFHYRSDGRVERHQRVCCTTDVVAHLRTRGCGGRRRGVRVSANSSFERRGARIEGPRRDLSARGEAKYWSDKRGPALSPLLG